MNEALQIGVALEANLIEQVRYYGKSPLVNLYDETNMIRMATGLPVSTLNLIAGARLSENQIEREIEAALTLFKRQKVPMIWWVGPTSLPINLGSYLEQHGLEKVFDMLGMFYRLETLEEVELPSEFTFKIVNNEKLLRIWAETQTRGFESDDAATDHIYKFEKSLGTSLDALWLRYIGFMDNEPVGVSILFQGAGVAAIFNVATVSEYRRHGIGTLMTKIPLLKAKALGYKYGVLKASPIGTHLYRAMGFNECGQIGLYYLPSKKD
ncbi:MAG: GNAT family N-acetyltransferase [Candidatus Hodarchaeota archaeon]